MESAQNKSSNACSCCCLEGSVYRQMYLDEVWPESFMA